ncbi:MAG: GNAT family N-acetyltransferase [Candidatus Pristimantibacillus lignocellulolyticus]|uniref:GNAT family N-acetyltransferase n=1 Tax=Candidatus Pristimantibacillus lignocellulolyticus TaxID=2994561 RepID=A0A9J6ZI80_9BACL|nr:MAG: GNAT family N-acetyltransferase [Candidatus Pristimantibacillus lignocellulolyticus]
MKVELQLCSIEEKFIINNIYPLYLHDLSEIWGHQINRYGIFEESDIRTLAEQNLVFNVWWEHPGVLFPYLIKVDDIPAGFAFVATPPYTPSPSYINYYLNEFFLLRTYRGKGVGEQAIRQLIDRMPGYWELQTNPTNRNKRAQNFWRKTLNICTNGEYTEQLGHYYEDGEKLVFRFCR